MNDICKVNNIEFYIKDNPNSKSIIPHKSKNKMMPSKMILNGIEVSFSKTSSNEDHKTHISTKNIIPLQHIDYLDSLGCFIDFSPPESSEPNISIQDMNTGKIYYTDKLLINSTLKCKNFRGSTPFVQIENDLWITIVHKRIKRIKNPKNIYPIKYDYLLLIFDSKIVNVDNKITIPYKCLKEILLDINSFEKDFIYITGIIVVDKIFGENNKLLKLEILISYGINDEKSGISMLKLKLK